MTQIGLKVQKMTSETISIRFLLLLRSYWVVTWPVFVNFEFGAKIGQKWPKKAQNNQKWPESLKSDIQNHFHRISASLAVILSGHMTSLQQFWIWGQKWLKKAPNDQKRPEFLKSDIQNHLYWITASLAVILSGHMTSLWQFWIWGKNWPNWPKMAKTGPKCPKMA